MTRRERTELFILDKSGLAGKMAQDISQSSDLEMVHEPQEGLVMVKMRDTARKTQFYLGEVLVTEARVRINGTAGLGIVQGTKPDLARDLAIIDAAWNGNHPSLEKWTDEIQSCKAQVKIQEQKKAQAINKTKVNFASMQEEDYVK
jgi:alpha-D-ribose 1-methylphosphonate 5-triphosphate synthase subunit PhnG